VQLLLRHTFVGGTSDIAAAVPGAVMM
jgi:hypothetical protein